MSAITNSPSFSVVAIRTMKYGALKAEGRRCLPWLDSRKPEVRHATGVYLATILGEIQRREAYVAAKKACAKSAGEALIDSAGACV